MNAAERAIADVLTFRRHWGDAWALERLETAALEAAQTRKCEERAQTYRAARAWWQRHRATDL